MRSAQAVPAPREPQPASRWLARLTKAEWIVLAALILLILSAVLPARVAWLHRRQRLMAQHDVKALERAILRYQREYGTWPSPALAGSADVHYGRLRPNAELMRILRAEEGGGNPEHSLNPQRLMFIEIEPHKPGWSGLDSRGEFLDPWGTPYQIVLDSNYDNAAHVENSIYARQIGVGVLIWSCGPDRKSETRDDLTSWSP